MKIKKMVHGFKQQVKQNIKVPVPIKKTFLDIGKRAFEHEYTPVKSSYEEQLGKFKKQYSSEVKNKLIGMDATKKQKKHLYRQANRRAEIMARQSAKRVLRW